VSLAAGYGYAAPARGPRQARSCGLTLRREPSPTGGGAMPLYVIERNFAEQLELTKEGADAVNAINIEEENRWLFSFLSADKKKTYCLYEAPNMEAIRRAAERAGIPADVITEVSTGINNQGELAAIRPEAFV